MSHRKQFNPRETPTMVFTALFVCGVSALGLYWDTRNGFRNTVIALLVILLISLVAWLVYLFPGFFIRVALGIAILPAVLAIARWDARVNSK